MTNVSANTDVPANIERCLAAVEEPRCASVRTHENAVRLLCGTVGQTLGLESGMVAGLQYAARLLDIGKVTLPDAIINKAGPLDAAEWETMRRHSQFGFDILSQSNHPLIKLAANVALYHHECWDGSGYPNGLAGEAIPREARIVAVCDVYHALREKRSYKPAFGHDQAMRTVLEGDGRTRPTHFDPLVLTAFKLCSHLIRDAFADAAALPVIQMDAVSR